VNASETFSYDFHETISNFLGHHQPTVVSHNQSYMFHIHLHSMDRQVFETGYLHLKYVKKVPNCKMNELPTKSCPVMRTSVFPLEGEITNVSFHHGPYVL
jgi:hypothetical protein